jgi:hypothetical protein
MEPLMSLEGYLVLENPKQARALLNKYFEQQGYTVVPAKENQKHNHLSANHTDDKNVDR